MDFSWLMEMDFNSWLVGVFNGIAIAFILATVFDEVIEKTVEEAIDRNMKKLL